MSVLTSRPGLRWLVPTAAAATVLGGSLVGTLIASADPTLPPRSAAQLLVDLQNARVDGLSGTVVQRADLGLPALPRGAGAGNADLTSLISGTNTLRIWYAGPDQTRLAVLGTLGETDVIRDGDDVWIWESRHNTATHLAMPDRRSGAAPPPSLPTPLPSGLPGGLPSAFPKTPQEAADAALAALDPSTVVTTAGSAKVAGRSAYELVLAPRDTGSLVREVRLAIDAEEHVPLRVRVLARGAPEPVFEVAFDQVSFARPDPAWFRFNPPPGAKVTEGTAGPGGRAPAAPDLPKGSPEPVVIGQGWTSVLVARLPSSGSEKSPAAGPEIGGLLERLPIVSGSWGSGRLLAGKAFSALLTDDGRVLVGAVAPDRLYRAAADPAARLGK
jgi:outer membrane lipoprotein-sorting protein